MVIILESSTFPEKCRQKTKLSASSESSERSESVLQADIVHSLPMGTMLAYTVP